jgi:hypothetical protein
MAFQLASRCRVEEDTMRTLIRTPCRPANLPFLIVAALVVLVARTPAFAGPCEGLTALKLPDTTITSALAVVAGGFVPPGGTPGMARYRDVPAFCRVTLEIKPARDSDIKVEVWLPLTEWNGKYLSNGNGGFAGSIAYSGLADAVKGGYATASTDTGHAGGATDGAWALAHPDRIVDFGYRGIHEMTARAKAVIQAFYGAGPRRSYFASCSNGGRQGLMEAQRFPGDYDGIIAGAPANYFTHLLAAGAWDLQATQGDGASYIPPSKIPEIGSAVIAACDARDGVADGLIGDPRECRFDPAVLLCKAADADTCLTEPQVAALRKVYAGPVNSKGERIFPGRVVGAEDGAGGWAAWVTGAAPGRSLMYAFTTNFFPNMVYDDPAWNFRTFDFDASVKATDERQARNLNATDPNLRAFQARGGKLILYHGWGDPAITALNTIDYYNSVTTTMAAREAGSFVRLFMVPGMQHCSGGPGPNRFGQLGPDPALPDPMHNMFAALEQWVEKGVAPERIVATKYVDDANPAQGVKMRRPLCAYPQVAKYKGTGDTNDEASFVCMETKK